MFLIFLSIFKLFITGRHTSEVRVLSKFDFHSCLSASAIASPLKAPASPPDGPLRPGRLLFTSGATAKTDQRETCE